MTGFRRSENIPAATGGPADHVRAWNSLRAAVLSVVRTLSDNGQLSGAGVRVQRFQLVSVATDHLVCRLLDGATVGTANVLVAKPYLLRASIAARGGLTYTYTSSTERTADDGSGTEDQIVTPAYVAGDEIVATLVRGGTGVTVASVPVLWLELNQGRAWAQVSA